MQPALDGACFADKLVQALKPKSSPGVVFEDIIRQYENTEEKNDPTYALPSYHASPRFYFTL